MPLKTVKPPKVFDLVVSRTKKMHRIKPFGKIAFAVGVDGTILEMIGLYYSAHRQAKVSISSHFSPSHGLCFS